MVADHKRLDNHARWKHLWRWHDRGCVWDKVATEWARNDCASKRERCQTLDDEKTFVIFVNRSTIHRTRIGRKEKHKVEGKVPRILGPADKAIHFREEGPKVQLCGDSDVAGK